MSNRFETAPERYRRYIDRRLAKNQATRPIEQVQYNEKDRQKGQKTKQTPKYVQEPIVNTKC